MPEKKTIERARADKARGKSAGTQAGEFVRESIHHIREGRHGARSTKQAIAIGLSEARRAGVDLPPPKKGTTSERTRRSAQRALAVGKSGRHTVNPRRSAATTRALKRESTSTASHAALSRHAKAAAHRHTAAERSASARKAARTRAREKSAAAS